MGLIRVLPDRLIDRIAAGEVVERPASVLKELLENSLDAGARTLQVRLRSGGKSEVRVVDDGAGMDRDDALLALERHATSKISQAEDLVAIRTLGFRGEALSSIAAVSRLQLQTAEGDGTGTEIHVRGGRIERVSEIARARGTTVRVEALFFNVPARRKFLRAEATELGHCVRLITRFCLAHPQLRVVLDHGDRRLLQCDPASDLAERVTQIHGHSFAEKLLSFSHEGSGLRVHGLAGRPAEALSRRHGQHFFVNGRIVRDRTLAHAVSQAYGNTTPQGRYAAIFLFVEIDPTLVDVNVHPQKTEVRFHQQTLVHDAVREAVRAALSGSGAVSTIRDLRPGDPALRRSEVAAATLSYLAAAGGTESARAASSASHRIAEQAPEHPPPEGPALPEKRALWKSPPSTAVPLAQFRDSYILAEDSEGLLIVDQHAAHERVLFERFLASAERNEVEVQKLLFPVTLELAPEERVRFEADREELRRLGFECSPFGGAAVRVDAVPAISAEDEPEALLRELLGEAARARSAASDLESLRRRLVTTAACRAAIKVHRRLDRDSMQGLLDDLFGAANPTTCPHGRPTVFRLTVEEIERTFRRK